MSKKSYFLVPFVLSLVILFSVSSVFAQAERVLLQQQKEEEAAAKLAAEAPPISLAFSKSGVLEVKRGEAGQPDEVRLVILSYKLEVNENNRALLDLNGKPVTGEFQGVLSDEEERLFQVQSFQSLD